MPKPACPKCMCPDTSDSEHTCERGEDTYTPSVFNSRVWVLGAGTFRDARTAGLTPKAARMRASFELRKYVTVEELREAIPELKRVGSVVYGIAARALRQAEAGR